MSIRDLKVVIRAGIRIYKHIIIILIAQTLWESDNMICLFDLDNCINVYLARIYLQKKGIHDNNSRQVRN